MKEYNILSMAEIKAIPPSNVNVISLFAGGGGSSTGYHLAGANVLLANEFIPIAADTYSANWPDTIVLRDDIRTLDPQAVLKMLNLEPGSLDVLDGSPPCCGFSASGKKEKGWNQTSKYSDTKQSNVETLFFEYIRFVDAIKPKVFIAENVKGLSFNPSKGYFNIFLRALKSAGYHVEVRIINSAYLGVPQRRERLIFVGIRNDIMKEEYVHRLHPKPINSFVSLSEAFATLQYDDTEIKYLMEAYKNCNSYERAKVLKYGEKDKKYFQLLRSNPDMPCLTIIATMDITNSCIKHWDNRPFTIGELKRIQSLPDDYILLGSYAKQTERIGRMVPPLVSKAILENIINLGVFK
jgi:DNA (cytosine-5)-methyltransferase 1